MMYLFLYVFFFLFAHLYLACIEENVLSAPVGSVKATNLVYDISSFYYCCFVQLTHPVRRRIVR